MLRPDGSVVQSPGYDAVTGVLYVPSHAFPMVPHDVNVDDASEAMRHLLDLVRDFPFASPEHAAAWIAGLLTIVARHTFTGNAPLFLVDANVRGAGKTLLAQIAGRIALGHELPVSSYSHDPAEMRKGITTMVMAGEPVVLLDHLSGVFGNEAVDRQPRRPLARPGPRCQRPSRSPYDNHAVGDRQQRLYRCRHGETDHPHPARLSP